MVYEIQVLGDLTLPIGFRPYETEAEIRNEIEADSRIVEMPSRGHRRGHSRKFGIAEVAIDRSNSPLRLALLSEDHGISPRIFLWTTASCLVVSVDFWISGVSFDGVRIFECKLDGIIYDLFISASKEMLIVVYEAGVLGMTRDGVIMWHRSTDIGDSVRLARGEIEIIGADGKGLFVNASSGTVV